MAQISLSKCCNCESEGSSYCYNCKKMLCEHCKLNHNTFTRGHTLTLSKNVDKVIVGAETSCLIHEQELSIFCLNPSCKRLICDKCAIGSHKTHKYETVAEHSKTLRGQMQKLIADFDSAADFMSKTIYDIKNDTLKRLSGDFNSYSSAVKNASDKLVDIIKSTKDMNVKAIEDNLMLKRENLNSKMSELTSLYEHFMTRRRELGQLLDITHDTTFVVLLEMAHKDKPDIPDVSIPSVPNHQFEEEIFVNAVVERIHLYKPIRCIEDRDLKIARQGSDINELANKVKENESTHKRSLKERNSEITRLESKVDELESEIRQKESYHIRFAEEKDSTIARLQRNIDELANEIKEKEFCHLRSLAEKGSEITRLENKVDELENENRKKESCHISCLEERDSKITWLECKVDELEHELNTKESYNRWCIQEREPGKARKESNADGQGNDLTEKESSHTSCLEERDSKITWLECKVDELEHELNTKESYNRWCIQEREPGKARKESNADGQGNDLTEKESSHTSCLEERDSKITWLECKVDELEHELNTKESYNRWCIQEREPGKARKESNADGQGNDLTEKESSHTRIKLKSVKSLLNPQSTERCGEITTSCKLVVALECCSTFSGCAFSCANDSSNVFTLPLRTNTSLLNTGDCLVPTNVLLDKDRKLVAFGYEAINLHSQLIVGNEHQEFYLFRDVDMFNAIEPLSSDTMMKDDTRNQEMPVIEFFSIVIQHLKNHVQEILECQVLTAKDKIRWVIPVPIGLSEPSRQLIQGAAEMAGITEDQIRLCVNHEAVLLYSHYRSNGESDSNSSEMYTTILFETIYSLDITLIRVTGSLVDENFDLWELKNRTPIPLIHYHEGFIQMFRQIIGETCWTKFVQENKQEYCDLYTDITLVAKRISRDDQTCTFKVPYALSKNETFSHAIQELPFGNNIRLIGDKMRLNSEFLRSLYDESIQSLIANIKLLLSGCEFKTILLAGEPAEYLFLKAAIEKAFPRKKIIVPKDPSFASLSGAILYGHLRHIYP